MRGLRPICDIQYLDYFLYALETASDDLASLHWRTMGGQKAPVVIRTKGHRLVGIWRMMTGFRGLYLVATLSLGVAALARTGSASQALLYAQHAVRVAPNSADAYTMLGYAQFASDRTKDAVLSWKRSFELRPDPAVQQLLAKAQREETVESDFSQGESRHFVLHYEGQQTAEAFRAQVFAALESDYDDLVRDLGTPPRDNILVTLYTEQAFFDVTQAPAWTGAINDGKLRIPIEGNPDIGFLLQDKTADGFWMERAAILINIFPIGFNADRDHLSPQLLKHGRSDPIGRPIGAVQGNS